jgi:hypothetical protein
MGPRSRDNSRNSDEPADWMARFRFPAGVRDFSLIRSIQTGSAAHQASYSMGTAGSFPKDKAAEA